jgi:endonuclease YncB( thermonuclease family)
MSHQAHARVVRWIDGDTVILDVYVWPGITVTEHIRLADVDTPEAGQPGYWEAKTFAMITCPVDSIVHVGLVGDWNPSNHHKRTFARLPGHVYPDHTGISVSQLLKEAKMTKADWVRE